MQQSFVYQLQLEEYSRVKYKLLLEVLLQFDNHIFKIWAHLNIIIPATLNEVKPTKIKTNHQLFVIQFHIYISTGQSDGFFSLKPLHRSSNISWFSTPG